MPLIDAHTRVRIVVSFVLMLSSYSSNEHPSPLVFSFFLLFSSLNTVVFKKTQDVTATHMSKKNARVGRRSRALANQKINTVLGLFVSDFPKRFFPKKKERKKERKRGDFIRPQKVGQMSNFIVRHKKVRNNDQRNKLRYKLNKRCFRIQL